MRKLFRTIALLLAITILSSLVLPIHAQDDVVYTCLPTNIEQVNLFDGFAYDTGLRALITVNEGTVVMWDLTTMAMEESTSSFEPTHYEFPVSDSQSYQEDWNAQSEMDALTASLVTRGNSVGTVVLSYPEYALLLPFDVEQGFLRNEQEQIYWWSGSVTQYNDVVYVQWVGQLTTQRPSSVTRYAMVSSIDVTEITAADLPIDMGEHGEPEVVTAELTLHYSSLENDRTIELPWAVMIGEGVDVGDFLIQSHFGVMVCRVKVSDE